jgi:molybdopterin/thiamine biosynthesis adenylyltransferase
LKERRKDLKEILKEDRDGEEVTRDDCELSGLMDRSPPYGLAVVEKVILEGGKEGVKEARVLLVGKNLIGCDIKMGCCR